jgi:cell division septal protein FtsQ
VGALAFWAYTSARSFALTSNYFKIKNIVVDSGLQFIEKDDLSGLIGQSIFHVNIQKLHKKLAYKYPPISELKIIKKLPNQLFVTAKRRAAVAQISAGTKVFTIDEWAIVLSLTAKRDEKIPLIKGAGLGSAKVDLGLPLKNTNLQRALEVLAAFKKEKDLQKLELKEIDVTNLSEIVCQLSNDVSAILDWDRIPEKMDILGLVLSKAQLDLKEVKYIDLRFKEPIIGKK